MDKSLKKPNGNMVSFVGLITQPKFSHSEGKKPFIKVRFCVNHYKKNQDTGKKDVIREDWYTVRAFGELAESSKELTKGSVVRITGRFVVELYHDTKTGKSGLEDIITLSRPVVVLRKKEPVESLPQPSAEDLTREYQDDPF